MKIQVTEDDIKQGIAGDCHCCAIALALARHTGDGEPMVYVDEWQMRLQVWSRSIVAPWEVTRFIHDMDDESRDEEGHPILSSKHEPFEFEIPEDDDNEWDDRCYGCEKYFKTEALDDEGYCEKCLEKSETRPSTGGVG